MFSEYEYEPTDIDDEVFLSTIPEDLLENAIDTQFNIPLEYRKKDYIQSFITKYNFSKENMTDDELIELDIIHNKFISFIKKIFQSYLSIGFPEIDNMDEDDSHELIHLTYRFFIKNIKKNFVTLISNYINKYEDEILNNEMIERKKDVTTLNFKVEIENENDVLILSNLDTIIRYILSQEFTIEEFFELCTSDNNCLETEFVKDKFNEYEITGNFIRKYIDMIDEDFIREIESKIRNKILKKYPKRKKEEKNIEDNNIETNDE